MNCNDCQHSEHEPGQCDRCNCGESAVVRLTGYPVMTSLASKVTPRIGHPEDIMVTARGIAHKNKHASLDRIERR